MKKLLALLTSVFIVAGISSVAYADEGAGADAASGGMLAAQSSLTTQDTTYNLGQTYTEVVYSESHNDCKFTLTEKSHVYAVYTTAYSVSDYFSMEAYDSNWRNVTGNARATESSSGLKSYYLKISFDLSPGTYYLRIINDDYGWNSDYVEGKLVISAEPVVSLSRPSIKSLNCPSAGKAKVKTSSVANALAYQYQFSKSTSFSGAKTIAKPTTTCTATGLAKGTYYYVRVRPYTVYNDGLKVYGNWSRAQAVYVKKLSNSITISTGSKTFKYAKLKKANQSFFVVADDQRNAKLTYKIDSAPAKAKKYLSLNKSSGKFTVKKGLKKGTYKIKLKVSAAATKNYTAASKTKQITLKVK